MPSSNLELMSKPEFASSPEEFQARYGLEPALVQNLVDSMPFYREMGMAGTLEQIYVTEIGPLPDPADEVED